MGKQLSLKENGIFYLFTLCYNYSSSRYVAIWIIFFIEQERWIWPLFLFYSTENQMNVPKWISWNNAIYFKSCVRNRMNFNWLNDWINNFTLGCSWGNYCFKSDLFFQSVTSVLNDLLKSSALWQNEWAVNSSLGNLFLIKFQYVLHKKLRYCMALGTQQW